MGTRGAMGFRIDGQDKVTYNHWDSYPSGLGIEILEEVSKMSIEEMTKIARNIVLITDREQPPTPEQKEALKSYTNLGVGEQSDDDWYCVLRNAQGGLSSWLNHGLTYMIDSQDFLKDSLFCEYAYIVNLDEMVFEFYKGFNKVPGSGRYGMLERIRFQETDNKYYGVALAATIHLDALKGRSLDELNVFVDQWNKEDEEESELPEIEAGT